MRVATITRLAVLLLVLASCGNGSDGAAGTSTPDSATTQATTGVHVVETELGSILVGPEGFTVYVFTADTDGESTCYESCAELWPPVPGDIAIGSDVDNTMFGTTTRNDGTEQLTVNGMPLYRYTPDTVPGDAKGQGFNGVWFVVDGEGNLIEADAGGSGELDYGY